MVFAWPSIPYPPARPEAGYWAPVTSTINWCEEDYYATIYSAEIVNSLTNLMFIGLGVNGVRSCLKYGHDKVFLIAFIGYLLVGSGSLAFHSTLTYQMQLVDELSMIYTTCIMCYATFSFSKSQLFRQFLAVGLASLALFVTLYYHYLKDPKFHQNAFALLSVLVLSRSVYVMEVNIRPSVKRGENTRRDEQILWKMWLLVTLGLAIFLGGFGIWSLDNNYCSTIRRWRHQVGLPWGILLEGHGWWHLMTGVGSYYHLIWAIWLRHCLNDRQEEYELKWPSLFFSIPEVVRVESTKNGHVNGHGKAFKKKSS